MAHDRDTLAEDWVALWQSEMAAMSADRELRESWSAMLALWAGATNAMLQLAGQSPNYDNAVGLPSNGAADAAQPAGAAPASAASVIGNDEARRLHERIAELESRLSEYDQQGHKPTRPRAS